MATNGTHANGTGSDPKITLYTNHMCPYAHRAHITLAELNIPFEEVIIDLEKPREPWYLEINPRGLVPAIRISYGDLKDEIVYESAIVAQFLADLKPSALSPDARSSPAAAYRQAMMNLFVDIWTTKVQSHSIPLLKMNTMEEKEEKSQEIIRTVQNDIEPMLKDANPFFGNSESLTFAEVLVAPFLLRMYVLCDDVHQPLSLKNSLDKLPNFSRWAHATMANKSVRSIWNEDRVVSAMHKRIEKIKQQPAK